MPDWTRYAIFVAPAPGPLADFTARWLGWDPARGGARSHPHSGGLPRPVEEITRTPRKYGFHGTIRAPFRLADGVGPGALRDGLATFCAATAPVELEGMSVRALGDFLALRPDGGSTALDALAGGVVRASEAWRAPLSAAEHARRRPEELPPRERALLARWGYPFVMEAFRFHMTLTGPLEETERPAVAERLRAELLPRISRPWRVEDLCLFGEAPDGRFHLLHRYALSG